MSRPSCFTIAICLCANLVSAAEWPQFRGPNGDGVSATAKLPTAWSETENIRWKVETPGRGWSSPVVADGRIWITSAIEREIDPKLREKLRAEKFAGNAKKAELNIVGEISLRLIGFDADSGDLILDRELLSVKLPQPVHSLNSYASPSPVWHNGRIYCHFGTFGTVCYDIEAAQIVWQKELPLEHSVGPGSSPVIVADRLIIPCDGADAQYVIALDAETGTEVWKTPRPPMTGDLGDLHKAFCTPLVIDVAGKEQAVVVGAQWVVSYDPADGHELWKVRHGDGFSNVPRPVFGRGMIFMSTGYTRPEMWAIRVDGEGDVTKSHVAWKSTRQIPTMPSPVLVGHELYYVNDQGIASCLDALTGEQRWQKRVEGNYCASAWAADGKVYFANREGKTAVVRASAEYERLADNQLDGQIFATPAVLGNALILRTDTHLYRIEAKN
jgi:outer membrane protein assembly factor BamB